jgi:orotidine-5'-phosphate decarboxylase
MPEPAAKVASCCTLSLVPDRPKHSDTNDQRRIVTPLQAVQKGSDYLVIGRPVTQANEPVIVLETILASLRE